MGRRRTHTTRRWPLMFAVVWLLVWLGGRIERYIEQSRVAEATTVLRRLFDSTMSYVTRQPRDPDGNYVLPSAVGPTPAELCPQGEALQTPRPADWAHPTWRALDFAMTEPHRYQFEFIPTRSYGIVGFTIRAIGDLDCDGVRSTFERPCLVTDDFHPQPHPKRIRPLE